MLTNLHDVGIFPGNFNYRLMMRNYQARRMFGVADCVFKGLLEDGVGYLRHPGRPCQHLPPARWQQVPAGGGQLVQGKTTRWS